MKFIDSLSLRLSKFSKSQWRQYFKMLNKILIICCDNSSSYSDNEYQLNYDHELDNKINNNVPKTSFSKRPFVLL